MDIFDNPNAEDNPGGLLRQNDNEDGERKRRPRKRIPLRQDLMDNNPDFNGSRESDKSDYQSTRRPFDDRQSGPERRTNPWGDRPTYNEDRRPSFNDRRQGYNDDRRPSYNEDRRPSFNDDRRPSYNDDRRPSYNDDRRPSYNDDRRPSYNDDRRPSYNDDRRPSYNNDRRPSYNDDRRPSYNDDRRPSYNNDRRPSYNDDRRPSYNPQDRRGFDDRRNDYNDRPRFNRSDDPYLYGDDKRQNDRRPSYPSGNRNNGPQQRGRNTGFNQNRNPYHQEGRPYGNRPQSNRNARPNNLQNKRQRPAPGSEGFPAEIDGPVRLNKYISYAGICSRREADKLIEAGAITVNGVVVSTLGARVNPGDKVSFGDQTLMFEKKFYVLLNKPKGYITTTDDPGQRKTVMTLVSNACRERIYPVGRLDRNTTGLLLFTNDGLMAKKLMHPAGVVRKLYHVVLDKIIPAADLETIAKGVQLGDEFIEIDDIAYANNAEDKREVGIAIHSGQNRVVRRIFESFGYKVVKLDRVMYAGLTKRNLPRGQWRFLAPEEVSYLKML